MSNITYDPITKQYTHYIPTPEEEAIMAEGREKERIEAEAFAKEMERKRKAKQYVQEKEAQKRERIRQRNAYMQYLAKIKELIAAGNTESRAYEILGPWLGAEDTRQRNPNSSMRGL